MVRFKVRSNFKHYTVVRVKGRLHIAHKTGKITSSIQKLYSVN